jgi:hypothetical protein
VAANEHSITQQRAVLTVLIAACARALEAFQVAENIRDEGFVEDLERIIARSRRELEALAPDAA